jgi:hypothetical protein
VSAACTVSWKIILSGVAPNAHYVGNPIATLTVPTVSFVTDLVRRAAGQPGGWYWRVPLEILVGVPLGVYLWVYVEVLVLGWVWI